MKNNNNPNNVNKLHEVLNKVNVAGPTPNELPPLRLQWYAPTVEASQTNKGLLSSQAANNRPEVIEASQNNHMYSQNGLLQQYESPAVMSPEAPQVFPPQVFPPQVFPPQVFPPKVVPSQHVNYELGFSHKTGEYYPILLPQQVTDSWETAIRHADQQMIYKRIKYVAWERVHLNKPSEEIIELFLNFYENLAKYYEAIGGTPEKLKKEIELLFKSMLQNTNEKPKKQEELNLNTKNKQTEGQPVENLALDNKQTESQPAENLALDNKQTESQPAENLALDNKQTKDHQPEVCLTLKDKKKKRRNHEVKKKNKKTENQDKKNKPKSIKELFKTIIHFGNLLRIWRKKSTNEIIVEHPSIFVSLMEELIQALRNLVKETAGKVVKHNIFSQLYVNLYYETNVVKLYTKDNSDGENIITADTCVREKNIRYINTTSATIVYHLPENKMNSTDFILQQIPVESSLIERKQKALPYELEPITESLLLKMFKDLDIISDKHIDALNSLKTQNKTPETKETKKTKAEDNQKTRKRMKKLKKPKQKINQKIKKRMKEKITLEKRKEAIGKLELRRQTKKLSLNTSNTRTPFVKTNIQKRKRTTTYLTLNRIGIKYDVNNAVSTFASIYGFGKLKAKKVTSLLLKSLRKNKMPKNIVSEYAKKEVVYGVTNNTTVGFKRKTKEHQFKKKKYKALTYQATRNGTYHTSSGNRMQQKHPFYDITVMSQKAIQRYKAVFKRKELAANKKTAQLEGLYTEQMYDNSKTQRNAKTKLKKKQSNEKFLKQKRLTRNVA